MFFKSVRFKVLLGYMLLLAATLSVFSLLIFGDYARTLYDDFDDLLSSKAEGIHDSVNIYFHAKRMGLLQVKSGSKAPGGQLPEDFLILARNWLEEKRNDPQLMSIFARILDAKGGVVVSSMPAPNVSQLDKDDFEDILQGEDSFDTVSGQTPEGRKIKYRLYSRPVMEGQRAIYVIQAGGPLTLVSLALRNLRIALLVLLPLTIILAGIPGVLLARLTLKPVDKMMDTLRQITAENLKLRIHMPDTKDEIKRLADTFNEMIDRLDRTFSSQRRFIRDISYELKAPMIILRQELEDAAAGEIPEKDQKELLTRAADEIDGYSKMIENLLVLSRSGDNRVTLEIKKINLTRMLDEIVNKMKAHAGQRGINLSFSCDDVIILDGDEDELRQMLVNLIDNAIKFTRRHGSVEVTAQKEGANAKIAVSDTGIGITEDEIPYIFDRFYQVNKARGPKSGDGFGLGLTSAKAVAEAHKGVIAVQSVHAKGSTFTVALPLSYPA